MISKFEALIWRETENLERIIRETSQTENFDLQTLAGQSSYVGYVLAPHKIIKFLEKFDIYNQPKELKEVLGIFFLWMKTVDDEIDNGQVNGQEFLDRYLETEHTFQYEETPRPSIILTDVLSELTLPNHDQVYGALEILYESVELERQAGNMQELIERTKNTGHHTALAVLEVMSPYMERNPDFERFFCEVGTLGNLADTAIDIRKDIKNDELNFQLGLRDYASLYWNAIGSGVNTLRSYPLLISEAIKVGVGSLIKAFRPQVYRKS